jgi:colanic acid biosynthesis glycosyl transferase WcaI
MKISIFSYNFHPEPTGIPAYNTAMARWLADKGQWDVVFHTGIPHYPWWKVHPAYAGKDFRQGRSNERYEGIEVRRVPHYVPNLPLTGFKRMLLDATWIWSTFWDSVRLRNRPDVILVIAPPFLSALLGLLLGLIWRRPVVYHVQDLQIDAAMDLHMINRPLGKILMWIERILLRKLDQVTTISGAMKRRIEEKTRLKRPVTLFPNWSDLSAIKPHQGSNAFRESWGVSESDTVVLYSGSLGRKQGLEFLLEAFARMPEQDHVHFLIAGEGPERVALESQAKALNLQSRLRFIPLAPLAQLAEFLSAADIHCIPQLRAAADLVLPSKLTNILGVARPVLATADAGTELARVVADAGCGLVVEPESPMALVQGLTHLISRPALRASMGAAGRRYAEKHIDMDQVLMRFSNQLEHISASHRGSRLQKTLRPGWSPSLPLRQASL